MTRDDIKMPPYLNAAYEGDDLFTGDQLRAAVLAEREACAKVAEAWDGWIGDGQLVASAIRARKETK